MGLKVVFTPEDLKAGEVDVVIVGLPNDLNQVRGTGWASNQIRFLFDYGSSKLAHDVYLAINYLDELNVVDYGNAGYHLGLNQLHRSR